METITLEQITREALNRIYPEELLEDCESALFLFGAAFYGGNDACFANIHSVRSTVVDVDEERLLIMSKIYPDDWDFVCQDAFEFAQVTDRRWDLVSVDPFTNLIDRCMNNVHLWTALANRYVTLCCFPSSGVECPPEGWKAIDQITRSKSVDWSVLAHE